MISTKVLLYKHKTLSDGKHPVVMQVIHNGKRKNISLGFYSTQNEWNEKKNCYKRTAENAETKNVALIRYMLLAQKIVDESILSGKPVSLTEFKRKFTGKQTTSQDVFSFVAELLQEMETGGHIGNLNVYRNVKNSLESFTNSSLTFADINVSFLHKYEAWLASEKYDREGCTESTIHLYMRTIRSIFNKAIAREVISQELYPFRNQFNPKGYSLSHLTLEANYRALSHEELEKFKQFNVEKYPELANSYHYFMFMYYCRGINWSDMAGLKHSNILNDRVQYKRKKTGKAFTVKLSEPLKAIIAKFNHSPYIFPILSDNHKTPMSKKNRMKKCLKQTNQELKQIAMILGIDPESITTYTARHTYAMALKRGGINMNIISDALGHADIKVTQHYLSRFEDDVLDNADEVL